MKLSWKQRLTIGVGALVGVLLIGGGTPNVEAVDYDKVVSVAFHGGGLARVRFDGDATIAAASSFSDDDPVVRKTVLVREDGRSIAKFENVRTFTVRRVAD